MSDIITVLVLALFLDRVMGDPPNRFHTTAWIGRFIGLLQARLPNSKMAGVVLFILVTGAATGLSYFILIATWDFPIIGILIAVVFLKLQIGWRSLKDFVLPVVDALEAGEVERAKTLVGGIVGRETEDLTQEHIISATIETTGENLPDSVISPLFYYGIAAVLWGAPAGIAAAVLHRTVNTLDAMVGYKKEGLENIGCPSARADDVLNYVPARLSALLIAASGALMGHDPVTSLRTARRDHRNTPSPNGGWPMAAMAGALNVRLEKPGVYTLGDALEPLDTGKVGQALNIVDIAVICFMALFLLAGV